MKIEITIYEDEDGNTGFPEDLREALLDLAAREDATYSVFIDHRTLDWLCAPPKEDS